MNYSEMDFSEEIGKKDNNGQVWNPSVAGESVIGKLVDKREKVGKYNQLMVVLENEMGETLTMFCQTVLERIMQDAEIGDILKIVYEGYIPGKNYNMYKVFRGKEDE